MRSLLSILHEAQCLIQIILLQPNLPQATGNVLFMKCIFSFTFLKQLLQESQSGLGLWWGGRGLTLATWSQWQFSLNCSWVQIALPFPASMDIFVTKIYVIFLWQNIYPIFTQYYHSDSDQRLCVCYFWENAKMHLKKCVVWFIHYSIIVCALLDRWWDRILSL